MKIIFSIVSIIILVVGTVGINFDAHYCGGKKIKSGISFLPKKLTCGMKQVARTCEKNNHEKFRRVCCANEHSDIQIDNDYVKDKPQSVTLPTPHIIPENLVSQNLDLHRDIKYELLGYSPPPLKKDIIILIESFLI